MSWQMSNSVYVCGLPTKQPDLKTLCGAPKLPKADFVIRCGEKKKKQRS